MQSLSILLFISFLFYSCKGENTKNTSLDLAPRPIKELRQLNFKKLKLVQLNRPFDFRSAIRTSQGGILYFCRRSGLGLASEDFSVIRTIAILGEGPAEVRTVLSTDSFNEEYWVIDRGHNAIKILSERDSLLSFYKFESTIEQGMVVPRFNRAYYSTSGEKSNLIIAECKYDDGQWHESTIPINESDNIDMSSLTNEGLFAANECGDIFYIPFYRPMVYKWSVDDINLKKFNLNYHIKEPVATRFANNIQMITDGVAHLISTSVNCDHMYVLSNISTSRDHLLLDLYDISDFAYLGSYYLPIMDSGLDRPRFVLLNYDKSISVFYEDSLLVIEPN